MGNAPLAIPAPYEWQLSRNLRSEPDDPLPAQFRPERESFPATGHGRHRKRAEYRNLGRNLPVSFAPQAAHRAFSRSQRLNNSWTLGTPLAQGLAD